MLSRLPTPTETDDKGRGLEAESLHSTFPLADKESCHAGVFLPALPQSLSSFPPPPTPPSTSCCSCASLLPRLLAAHRLEMRRLLRGALASLGRRLDSLERRSRRKGRKMRNQRKEGRGGGLPTFNCNSTSYKSTPVPLASIASHSSNHIEPPPPTSSQSEQVQRNGSKEEVSRKMKRRKNLKELHFSDMGEENNKDEKGRRFVGQMAMSVRGEAADEDESLILYDFNHNKRRRVDSEASQSGKEAGVVIKKNGYSSPSQNALPVFTAVETHQNCSQSVDLTVSAWQWCFSDITHLSSIHNDFHLWLSHAPSHISPATVLHLSAVTVETMFSLVKGGVCWSPPRPLKDWTAPPSVSSDHCYIRRQTSSLAVSVQRQQKQRTNYTVQSLRLSWRRALPLPHSANELSDSLPADQSATVSEYLSTNEELGKRVSLIRIRRASPREALLTPMGLPKVKRLKKKEFSLEEIYTNKNYKSPPNNRSLETIFEEPREKDGALLLIGQQKRRRLLLFSDFTQPRKRKRPQLPRKRAAARHTNTKRLENHLDLDVMLVERLSELEDFLTQQGLDV